MNGLFPFIITGYNTTKFESGINHKATYEERQLFEVVTVPLYFQLTVF